MSINITSTSDQLATDTPTPDAAHKEGVEKYQGASALIAAVPDPAVIAKLANEFFAALPGSALPASVGTRPPSSNEAGANPSARGAVPDYPREMFSFPAVPKAEVLHEPAASPASALNEADFRAIAASLAGALPLAPQVTAAAPTVAPTDSSPSSSSGQLRSRRTLGCRSPDSARRRDVFLSRRPGSAGVPSNSAAERFGSSRNSIFAARKRAWRQD